MQRPRHLVLAPCLLVTLLVGAGTAVSGPFDIPLLPGPKVPTAEGEARLLFASSPFGVAVTVDGRHRYDIRIALSGLPDPTSLGAYHAYVAWEVSTDLADWHRLGAVQNGTTTVGQTSRNKFLLVITAEPDSMPSDHSGPTVMHGTSPSGWLQTFMTHPMFRGISQ
ncbi:MAG TPA: hypothetical protein VFN22_07610 [Gemmatimonadales bacterium]|nr:hypothetical protein [Gemmatimonadales bacterium]